MRLSLNLLILITLILSGCGRDRTESQHTETQTETVTKTTIVQEKAQAQPDGTLAVVERVTTTSFAEQLEKGKADTEIKEFTRYIPPPIVDTGLKIAAAGANTLLPGSGLSAIILGLMTAATTAYGVHKGTQANAERKRADEHKKDAEEGWEKADTYAKALPPGAVP